MAFEFINLNARSALREISKTYIVRAFIIDMFCTSALSEGVENSKDLLYFCSHLQKANGTIANTFNALEPVAIKANLDDVCAPNDELPIPPVYYIGLLVADNHRTGEKVEDSRSSEGLGGWVRDSLWLELGARSSGRRSANDSVAALRRATPEQECFGKGHGNGNWCEAERKDGFVHGDE
ncbi:hypothetical protein FNV43_RR24796 [Rhamnella rubrinervis]|uniref:Uncharacterized protein n=1 Tax=Rhamnella rubrinervis TaxID=2594499 RepID=A0A8K0GR16_9ROSA|nr:hypothetical protein FNV43_RR24796 [Rhamnella rubrinervis]